MLVLLPGLLMTGCELLADGSAKDQALTFPPATTIVVRAKSIDITSTAYLDKMNVVKTTAITTKFTKLIDAAPANQVRKYELQRDHALESLRVNYQSRKTQILEWES